MTTKQQIEENLAKIRAGHPDSPRLIREVSQMISSQVQTLKTRAASAREWSYDEPTGVGQYLVTVENIAKKARHVTMRVLTIDGWFDPDPTHGLIRVFSRSNLRDVAWMPIPPPAKKSCTK